MFYYVSWDSETKRSLWQLDLATKERSLLLSYQGRDGRLGEASVSADGRYVAFSHIDGIDLLDLAAGERQRLLTRGDRDACIGGDISECVGYGIPQWSPDGRLLLVGKGFYEGAAAIVVDPFQEPPAELISASIGGPLPSSAVWSPASDAFCAYGQYAAQSGLYLASAPDWQPQNLLPEYEVYDARDPRYVGRTVTGCAWLDQDRIVFSSTSTGGIGDLAQAEIAVF